MERTYTARFFKGEDGWWIGQLVEMPAAVAQGKTIEEARVSLREAAELLLESYREDVIDGDTPAELEEMTVTA